MWNMGPFENLVNMGFEPLPDGGSCIHFFIDFEFRATLQALMLSGFFTKAFTPAVMQAFVDRAEHAHGNPALPAAASD